MELKDKIISSYANFEKEVVATNDIHTIRKEALAQFDVMGFPTKKLEAWKYTSLKSVLKSDFEFLNLKSKSVSDADLKPYVLEGADTYRLIFIDGVFNEALSNIASGDFEICNLSSALGNEVFKPIFKQYFNTVVDKDHLTTLNTAFTKEGVFIYVPKNKTVDKPVEVVYLATGEADATLLQPRSIVVAEENAHVQITERHQNLSSNVVLTNAVTEMFSAKSSTIDCYKIQNDSDNTTLVDNVYVDQKSNSVCSVHTFTFGGKITRNNLNYYQNGEHIDSIMKGVTILEGKQHVDHYTLVHHIEPNCESHQDYKGIYNDKSTGVFNGKVIVNKEAQKTNAYQQNNNILVSDKATVNAKPQLEIFADDVRCSHGCTIGQLDEDALFYMQQRGLPKKEAKALLMYAFSNTVLESVKLPAMKLVVNKLIAEKLGVNIDFAE